jgi:hypothetical protein
MDYVVTHDLHPACVNGMMIGYCQLHSGTQTAVSGFITMDVVPYLAAGLSFEVVSLERVVEGSNIPLPKTLIKSVLNLVMPSVRWARWAGYGFAQPAPQWLKSDAAQLLAHLSETPMFIC